MAIGKKIIYGCEGNQGQQGDAYLTRYTLLETKWIQVCIHHVHRSDDSREDLHDHPWSFLTIPLWRGYNDVTSKGVQRCYPLIPYLRRATHTHRIQLINERPAFTFVLMFRRVKEWGFATPKGWVMWQEYFKQKGCV